MKKFLTSEEAIELLPEGEEIHTFYNFPFGFVGADWEREDIIERLNNPNYKIEVCGEAARAMNHGICVYKKGETIQSNILFIETNYSLFVIASKSNNSCHLSSTSFWNASIIHSLPGLNMCLNLFCGFKNSSIGFLFFGL